MKKSFVVKNRKVTEPQTDENLLQKLPKKSNFKISWKKKVGKKYSFETQKLSFGASPTLHIGNASLISDLKLRIKIHEKHTDPYTILKCVFLTDLKGKEQELFESESVHWESFHLEA